MASPEDQTPQWKVLRNRFYWRANSLVVKEILGANERSLAPLEAILFSGFKRQPGYFILTTKRILFIDSSAEEKLLDRPFVDIRSVDLEKNARHRRTVLRINYENGFCSIEVVGLYPPLQLRYDAQSLEKAARDWAAAISKAKAKEMGSSQEPTEEEKARLESFENEILPICRFLDSLERRLRLEKYEEMYIPDYAVLHAGREHRKGYFVLTNRRLLFTDPSGKKTFLDRPLIDVKRIDPPWLKREDAPTVLRIYFEDGFVSIELIAALPSEDRSLEEAARSIYYTIWKLRESGIA